MGVDGNLIELICPFIGCIRRGPTPASKMKLNGWILALGFAIGPSALAQTTQINGDMVAYQSTGINSGSTWILDRDGYVGTYITLAAPGNVTVHVGADGTASGGINP